MSWYLCRSLKQLRKQIDEAFPNRDLKSEGAVGDTSHSRRKSSHNPDSRGAVRAIDVTHNPIKGLDCNLLLHALLSAKDSRIWYLIFNGKIYNRKVGFAPAKYSGSNDHKKHLHISVADKPEIYDNGAEWNLKFDLVELPSDKKLSRPTIPGKVEYFELSKGSKGEHVRRLQERLVEKGYLKPSDVDGSFGTRTQSAVQRFQLANKLISDGIAGKLTFEKLGL